MILNVNDAEIRTPDCRIIKKDIGPVDAVLNQFSIAGYSGLPDPDIRLKRLASQILKNVSDNHRDLGAQVTIPFASFIYFCTPDNCYVNRYVNTVGDVFRYLEEQAQRAVILYPGDVYDLDVPYDSSAALAKFVEYDRDLRHYEYEELRIVPFEEIELAFKSLCKHLRGHYPELIFHVLRPFVVCIPDLGVRVRFTVRSSEVERLDVHGDSQLEINSQPLYFALRYPYGVQTLGVSARAKLRSGIRNWQLHRILFAMNNAEVYLKPRYLFRRENREYFVRRLVGGGGNIVRRLKSMMT